MSERGFFGIGIENVKRSVNFGTLFRSAYVFHADFVFTTGQRVSPQSSDTYKSWRHLPLWHFDSVNDLASALPHECLLIGVEMAPGATQLHRYVHPERACYLLGAEDNGLSKTALGLCHEVIALPGERSLNVSACGTVILWHRIVQRSQS